MDKQTDKYRDVTELCFTVDFVFRTLITEMHQLFNHIFQMVHTASAPVMRSKQQTITLGHAPRSLVFTF